MENISMTCRLVVSLSGKLKVRLFEVHGSFFEALIHKPRPLAQEYPLMLRNFEIKSEKILKLLNYKEHHYLVKS